MLSSLNKTLATKHANISNQEYDQWRKDNPDWDKDWSKGAASAVSGTGDVYSRTDGGWNEVLSKVAQVPGSRVKPQKTTHI